MERLSQRVCNDGEQFCAQMTPGTNQRSKPVHTATLGRTESKGGDTHLRGSLAELLAGTASAPRAQRSRGTPCRICPPPERQVLSCTYESRGNGERTWCMSCRRRQRGARSRPCTRSPSAGCSPRTLRRRWVVAAVRPDSVSRRRRVRRPRGGLQSGSSIEGQVEVSGRGCCRQRSAGIWTGNAPMHHWIMIRSYPSSWTFNSLGSA
jgi:hypothetical protein